MSTLYPSGKKCQHYTQVVKNVKNIHKWLKCQYVTKVVNRLKMSTLYISG